LIEEARTNSVQRSAEFDNAYWSKVNGSISANATTAPDGATSADRLVEDSTASVSHLVARSVAGVAPTQQLTGSCFIKADTRTFARIVVWDQNAAGNNVGATFDVSGGTVASAGANAGNATGASASITNVGNGWYRCSVSGIPNTSGSDSGLAIYLMSSGGGAGSTAYTGDGTSRPLHLGRPTRNRRLPTSYIPTTSAAATRSADSAVVTPISSFYNQSEGTLFAEASLPQTPNNAFAADIYTDVQNRIGILRGPNTANMNSFVFAWQCHSSPTWATRCLPSQLKPRFRLGLMILRPQQTGNYCDRFAGNASSRNQCKNRPASRRRASGQRPHPQNRLLAQAPHQHAP
jgi:hypothetical protein